MAAAAPKLAQALCLVIARIACANFAQAYFQFIINQSLIHFHESSEETQIFIINRLEGTECSSEGVRGSLKRVKARKK